MTNTQILKKAIGKAFGDCTEEYAKSQIERDDGYRVIFSHQFAKAFWGNGRSFQNANNPSQTFYEYDGLTCRRLSRWQYHLQMMVLEKEPLKYLEKFLEEK